MNHGKLSENILEQICFNIFSPDLVAKSPIAHEKSGDKELTDILIYLGNEIIIFQSKSVDIDASDLDKIKEGRIQKKIDQAIHQFSTTLNAKEHKIDVSFINGVGIRSKLDWNKVKINIGIITINLKDSKYKDPEYRTSFPLAVSTFHNIDVHIFLLRDLYNMDLDVSTPSDFLTYLSDRKIASDLNKMWVGNELDFTAFIKTHYDKWENFKNGLSTFNWIGLQPGLWEDYIINDKINEMKRRNIKDSYLFDKTLSMLKTTIKYSIDNNLFSELEAINNYEIFITLLSKIRRIQRRDISRIWKEKYLNTKKKKLSYYLSIYKDLDLSIFFLVSNEEDREKRQNGLINFCLSAAHVIDTNKLIGITTQGYNINGENMDYVYYNDVNSLKVEKPLIDPKLLFRPKEEIISQEWEIENG